jgi:hypothetical protein
MRKLLIALLLTFLLTTTTAVHADDGGSYSIPAPSGDRAYDDGGSYAVPANAEGDRVFDDGGSYARPCETHRWDVNPGKSTVSFKGQASDGCHVYIWTNVQGQDDPGDGEVTFTTNSKAHYVWDPGATFKGPEHGWCQYQAAHEAHGMFVNHFQVADGTEVTVRYSCT